jgi:pyridoxal biosynthesis lyase PdxS
MWRQDLGEALRRIGEGASVIDTNSKLAPSEPMQDRDW